MPNRVQWVQIAVALTRIGAVLVPLSTLLQPPELVAQLRAASVQVLIAVEEFRGHRYLDDLADVLKAAELPALRKVWTPEQLPHASGDQMVDAMAAAVTPSDTLVIMFTSGSSGPPKGVIHSHGNALAAVRSGLAARCIDADTRLYLPMPFFWVGGFGSGVLSALLAGATLVTEEIPQPETTLRLLERERVTLFRGWPDQAEALARQSASVGADLSALRPGSLEALLPPEQRAAAGARAKLFGMTESFGPYCGYPADTDMPRSAWGSCGKPFDGMEVRIVDPDTGEPRSRRHDRHDPDPRTAHVAGHLPAQPRRVVHAGRLLPDRRPRAPRRQRLHVLPRPLRRHVQGQRCATVYPGEVEQALRTIDGVDNAFVTDVSGAVGAVVIGDTTVEQLHAAARKRLSSFKIPTVWLLVDSDDAIPRGGTGKVDVHELRQMLTTQLEAPQ